MQLKSSFYSWKYCGPKLAYHSTLSSSSISNKCTGCASHFENLTNFKIVKEPLLVLKQTIPQQKALDLSFNLAPWKWAWHYQEGVTMTCHKRTFFTPRAPMLFAASERGALLMMPCPLLACQIKAEITGFLLRYCLFLYFLWFFQNIEKGWRKFFEIRLFPRFLKMTKNKNIVSPAFFNILKES